VIVANHDPADELAVESGFVGDRAHDVAGSTPVRAADSMRYVSMLCVRSGLAVRSRGTYPVATLPRVRAAWRWFGVSRLLPARVLARLALVARHIHQ
jgi:hypothetical protein